MWKIWLKFSCWLDELVWFSRCAVCKFENDLGSSNLHQARCKLHFATQFGTPPVEPIFPKPTREPKEQQNRGISVCTDMMMLLVPPLMLLMLLLLMLLMMMMMCILCLYACAVSYSRYVSGSPIPSSHTLNSMYFPVHPIVAVSLSFIQSVSQKHTRISQKPKEKK